MFQRTAGDDDYDNVIDYDDEDDDIEKDYNDDIAEEQPYQLFKCVPEDPRLTIR